MSRVLVIDDEAHVRRLYDNLLTREGFEVISAACPEEAFDIIRGKIPDIIVLDIELDEDNGLKLIEKFKVECPDIPIILNSAYSIYMSDLLSFKFWITLYEQLTENKFWLTLIRKLRIKESKNCV